MARLRPPGVRCGPVRMRRIKARTLGLLLALLMIMCEGAASQIYPPILSVSVRPQGTTGQCDDAPDRCFGETHSYSLGRHRFDFYIGDLHTYDPVDSVRFALDWPEEWNLTSFRLCGAENPEGDLSTPDSGLLFVLDPCRMDDQPFLVLQFNCTIPGRLTIVEHPGTGDAAVHYCDGDLWVDEYYVGERYVEIGDYCGWTPQEDPCTYCFRHNAARFDPSSLEISLDQGQVLIDTVQVADMGCFHILPECDHEQIPYGCVSRVESSVDWASVLEIDEQDDVSIYEITVDADSLWGGEYHGRIWAHTNCEWCVTTCMELTLFVDQPSAIRPSTWGRIKSLLR